MIKRTLNIIMLLCAVSASSAWGAGDLESLMLNAYKKEVFYMPPNQESLAKAQELFANLLKSQTISEDDVAQWQQLGFTLQEIQDSGTSYALLMESGAIAGHGFYLVKLNSDTFGYVLQAPHRPSDLQTHAIALKMFIEGSYKAAAWSSTHRASVDLCKEPNSYFNSFTKAVGQSFTQATIVQLHSFDDQKHDTTYDMIFSSTQKKAPAWLSLASSCLKNNMSFAIAEYPQDIRQLGGTLNINAHNFYAINPKGQFFHVEMSMPLRDNLLNNNELRNKLTECILGIG